jgi:hypothetical protein
MNMHANHQDTTLYVSMQNGMRALRDFFFGTPEELREKRLHEERLHPGQALDGLDHPAALEDDMGEM